MKISKCLLVSLIAFVSLSLFAQDQHHKLPYYVPKPAVVDGIVDPVLNLNGTWDFNAAPPSSFWKSPSHRKLSWDKIQVPGEWYMQGFDVQPGTRAAYHKELNIPGSYKGKRILISCDGLYSDARVYMNGELVGTHQGGFTPAQFDLTPFVKNGKTNHLTIGLISESIADTLASATQYAAHPLGGITRKIELYVLPETHLAAWHYETQIDASHELARVNIGLDIFSLKPSEKQITVEAQLKDLSDPAARIVLGSVSLKTSEAKDHMLSNIPLTVYNPSTWDPEHPRLYELRMRLYDKDLLIEEVVSKLGIRQIEVVGNKVFVNGRDIKLRGINRHEVDPLRGRSLTLEQWKADARLFKEANLNYIRTSHYPPAEEFISLCDSLGFFVELEAPHCWVGHGANAHWQDSDPHSKSLFSLIRNQALETVAHYRNHPSVLIWSMANESAWGPIWDQILTEINLIDPTRPVSFHDQAYGGYNNYGSSRCQIANIHYPGPGGPDVARRFNRPLLFGEYAHLNTYNRQEIVADPGVRDAWGRGLESMWEDMYHSAGCLGGAIWSGIDDVFYLPSGKAVGYGEWGPIDGWRRTKPEYWHLKKIYSPVKIWVRQLGLPKPGQALAIPVENRQLFSNLREVTIQYKLGNKVGRVVADVDPRQFGVINIPTGDQNLDGQLLELSFISNQGYVIDQYRIQLGQPKPESDKKLIVADPELLIQDRRAVLQWGDNQWIFDGPTGMLSSATSNHHEIVAGGPTLMMLPLSSGPCNTEHSLEIEPLNDLCSGWNGQITQTGQGKAGPFVKVEGNYNEASIELIYSVDSTGLMVIDYSLTAKIDINPRQIGLVFDLPASFENLSWERDGQWTVYPDDHIGRTHGQAVPFSDRSRQTPDFGVKPLWTWEEDPHSMGSNDFRATRDRLFKASLLDGDKKGIAILSDGHDAARAWVGKDHIHLLVAGFSTAGGDMFFSSHLEKERRPLKAGDVFKGTVKFKLQ